jgi:hypothetical protein
MSMLRNSGRLVRAGAVLLVLAACSIWLGAGSLRA